MEKMQQTVSKMNLDHLKTFHVVAQCESFTKASEILCLTQPAVTQQIKGLEHALKSELFDRSRKKIKLTAKGKILFSYTRQLLGLFEEIEGVFNDLNHLQIGNLTVATSAVMASYYLPKILSVFQQSFPLIKVNVKMGDSQHVVDWVSKHEADIGLSRRTPHCNGVDMELFLQEQYICVARVGSPLTSIGRPLTAKEFAESYFVMRQPGSRMRTKIEEWFVSQGVDKKSLEPRIEVNNLEVSKELILNGLGVAAFPVMAVREELKQGKLQEIPVQNFSVQADYYLSIPKEHTLSMAAFKFHHLLKEPRNLD